MYTANHLLDYFNQCDLLLEHEREIILISTSRCSGGLKGCGRWKCIPFKKSKNIIIEVFGHLYTASVCASHVIRMP